MTTARRFFNSHCQITKTSQPCSANALRFFLSLHLFRLSFGNQNSRLVFGMRPLLQPWECQKHPWTSITLLRPGNAKSGLPGRSDRCSRKRYPSLCTRLRTASSGNVFLLRMARMFALRSIPTHSLNLSRSRFKISRCSSCPARRICARSHTVVGLSVVIFFAPWLQVEQSVRRLDNSSLPPMLLSTICPI